MRSQQEIKEKIAGIYRIMSKLHPKKDPFYQQYKILVHKLTWANAKDYLKKEDWTEETRIEWEKNNNLEKKFLLEEIKEQVDIGAMHVCANDVEYAFHCATGLLAMFWLLGPSKDKVLEALFKDYLNKSNIYTCCDKTFKDVANELGLDWERMKMQYKGGMFTSLTDKYGRHFKNKAQDQVVEESKGTQEESIIKEMIEDIESDDSKI